MGKDMNKENNAKSLWNSFSYRIRLFSLLMWDILMIHCAQGFSILIRFDLVYSKVDPYFWDVLWSYNLIHIAITIAIFSIFHLYSSLWRFAGMEELANIVGAAVCSAGTQFVGIYMMGHNLPRSYYIIYPIALTALTTAGRFFYRFLRIYRASHRGVKQRTNAVRCMIIGAGSAGNLLLTEIRTSQFLHYEVPCIIDDDPAKQGSFLQGVPIVGDSSKIMEMVEKYEIEEIIIAIPSLVGKGKKELLDICATTGCKLKTVPGLYQLVNNEVSVSKIREVEIEDLLGRAPVKINNESILGYVKDQVVMVTGGGGSIGSEICRQIAANHPKQLIILDNYENNAYELQMELKLKLPELNMTVLIASVQSRQRISSIFDEYKPNLVFHAAAHKHVPLMEDSPCEAIKNNVLGTYNVAHEANRSGVKKMVHISTDKAVRPTNVMGASKRICEMIIQSFNNISETDFVAVRFGNVLGSNGSVIPLFKEQIKNGGPVTVTHRDIIRYFMTIPEAVSLVLQAGAYANGGEIFILDMGEPVRILDLAENLIRLSGLTPYADIDIEFTGLRPGEKLYEELLIDDANKKETANSRIFIGTPDEFDDIAFWQKVRTLKEAALDNREKEIRGLIQDIVPEYTYKK